MKVVGYKDSPDKEVKNDLDKCILFHAILFFPPSVNHNVSINQQYTCLLVFTWTCACRMW